MATTCAAASLPAAVPTWSSLASIFIGAIAAFLGAFGGVKIAVRADRKSKSEDNESRDLLRVISETTPSRADSSTQPTPEACPESESSSSNSGDATNDISDAGGLPAAFVCCITSELFLNPVVASDGHSYERAAIEKWFERHDTSPRTGERLVSKDILPNHNLRSQVLEYRRAEGLPDPPPWVPPEPTEAPAPTAAQPAEPAPAAAPAASSPSATASGPAGAAATPRQFRINIPQAEATALLASIRQVLDRSPALLTELGLAQAGAPSSPSENEQAAARILADPRLLSLVARHAAGTSGLEPLAPRLTRAAHTISQLLATEMQARRVAQNQAPGSQPIRPTPPAFAAAAGATATSAATAGGGSGGGSGIGLAPPDDPPLFRAARAGDCGAVQRELLALQRTQPHLFASPTSRPPSGNNSSTTPQHWATADRPRDRLGEPVLAIACQLGHLDLVRMLTSPAFGANPALPSLRDGTTPLHHAARTANAGVLQCLLDALQAPPSEELASTSANALASALKARNHAGETPLHVAAVGRIGGFGLGNLSSNHNSPVEEASAAAAACATLLAAGADVSAVTENGCTALHLAALVPGRSGVAELLLREGALPGAQEFVKHSTPVHHAAQSGDPLMLHAILGHVHRDAAKLSREGRASSGGGDNDNEDAVEAAGRAASSTLANQAGKRGLVPLHCAAASGSALAVRALVSDYGARLDARGELDGASPLTVAVVRRHVEALKEILALGGSVAEETAHAVSRGLDGPVHLAIAASRPDIATLLFDHGAPLDARTKNQSTVLHLAAWFGLRDLATVILDKQPSMLLDCTEDGDTALHQAAFNDHTEVCLLLLERGADPNSQKRDGSTALHLCVAKGFLRVVRLLLSRGANPSIANARGLDVLSLAHAANQPNVAAVLNEHLGRSASNSS